jgi:hypothetical protein
MADIYGHSATGFDHNSCGRQFQWRAAARGRRDLVNIGSCTILMARQSSERVARVSVSKGPGAMAFHHNAVGPALIAERPGEAAMPALAAQ